MWKWSPDYSIAASGGVRVVGGDFSAQMLLRARRSAEGGGLGGFLQRIRETVEPAEPLLSIGTAHQIATGSVRVYRCEFRYFLVPRGRSSRVFLVNRRLHKLKVRKAKTLITDQSYLRNARDWVYPAANEHEQPSCSAATPRS